VNGKKEWKDLNGDDKMSYPFSKRKEDIEDLFFGSWQKKLSPEEQKKLRDTKKDIQIVKVMVEASPGKKNTGWLQASKPGIYWTYKVKGKPFSLRGVKLYRKKRK